MFLWNTSVMLRWTWGTERALLLQSPGEKEEGEVQLFKDQNSALLPHYTIPGSRAFQDHSIFGETDISSISPQVEKPGSEPNIPFTTQTNIWNGQPHLSTASWANPLEIATSYKHQTLFLCQLWLWQHLFLQLQGNYRKSSKQRDAKKSWLGGTHSRSTLSRGLRSFKWQKRGFIS